MVNLITKYVEFCRASGLKISTSEVLDCMTQLKLINVYDEPLFRRVLNVNFVKSWRDQSKFDRLYNLFFYQLKTDISFDSQSPTPGHFEDILEMLKDHADKAEEDSSYNAIVDFLSGDSLELLKKIQQIEIQEENTPEEESVWKTCSSLRLEITIQLNRVRSKIGKYLDDNSPRLEETELLELRRFCNERLEAAEQMASQEPIPQDTVRKHGKAQKQALDELGEVPFSQLTQEEAKEIQAAIERLARKLKDIISRRYKRKKTGVVDIKKTLSRASRYQGIPMEIKYRNRPPRKTRIVTLCDVSYSVWQAVPFMLNVIYSLQECFSRVKSFIFISRAVDVSDVFEKHDINEAIEEIMADVKLERPRISVHFKTKEDIMMDNESEAPEISDYGQMFSHFKKKYMDDLDKKTTLIILGDGRSNYLKPQEKILDEMREKCRRIIWLNPEAEQLWGTGDSEINIYKTYCHELRPCQNLNQLIGFIEELVL